jgi:hypothetical protein
MMSRILRRCSLGIGLLVAAPVWAVDGVTEINQTSIVASGGFPYTIGEPGSYRLTSNVTVPDASTTAIVITSPGVTLDLNGFAVLGPVTCSGDGSTRYQNKACTLSGNGLGILVEGEATGLIYNGTIRGMGGGGISVFSNFTFNIDKVTVEGNGGIGINLYQGKVTNSSVRFNGGAGIEFCDCGGGGTSFIEGNVVERNRGDGIHAGSGIVQNNYIFYNGGAGVNVRPAGNNIANVIGNTIQENSGNGINATHGTYRGNMIYYNLETAGHQVLGGVSDGGQNFCWPGC